MTNRNSAVQAWFMEAAYLGCPDGKKEALWYLRPTPTIQEILVMAQEGNFTATVKRVPKTWVFGS